MQRRRLLRTLPGVALAGAAGCLGNGSTEGDGTETPTPTATPTETPVTDGPDGVYVQSYLEGMAMPESGMAMGGDYSFGLMLVVPHNFWTVTGSDLSHHQREDSQSVHLMVQVWDDETGVVLPESGVSVEILQDGETVSEEVIYPMLSQRMGFHYGGNFTLDGDGSYTARVSASPLSAEPMGSFAGRFDEETSVDLPFEYNQALRDQMTVEELDQSGDPGAIRPMEMGSMPIGIAAPPEELPGETVGTQRVDGADLVLKSARNELAGDAGAYLYVSARTPYNDLVLPMMSLDATVTREGDSVYDGQLTRAIHPDLQYHYGTRVDSIEPGDEVSVDVVTPPQVGRHEGYETAFLRMEGATFSV
ncbi:iron transporter [Haloarchaeobius baliensis]|uniref:iron transporter n=1 Tax=Haloarchaeobius baliensis TaxID=1670458 RepID=UPI003F884AB9